MSHKNRPLQFSPDPLVREEIEQYCYGKYGVCPAKALPGMVLAIMSKNPLTEQQIARIEAKYKEKTIAQRSTLSGTAMGNKTD